jgi:hypothetical protein
MTVDRLFFCDDAEAWTPDAIVRIAARGIVERVALLCPGAVDHLLERARPPYEPRGPHWPDLNVDEARAFSTFGGKIVWRDLRRYVAEHCFSPLLKEKRERRVEQGDEDAPHERKPRWSDELRALCTYASHMTGITDIAPATVRDAMIAAKVLSWGWSEVGFCCYEWDKLPEGCVPPSTHDVFARAVPLAMATVFRAPAM